MTCISTVQIKNEKGRFNVPCGKCYPCLARRTSNWSFRLCQEADRSRSAFFITLTYEFPPMTENGFMTLHMHHVQAWFKKIRKMNQHHLKYYYVGEYGTKHKRPHYHVLLFNAELDTIIGKDGMRAVKTGVDRLDGKFEHKTGTWIHGYVTVGKVNEASVGYVLQYMTKGTKVPEHSKDDRNPEFSRMSKKLGDNYINDINMTFHRKRLNSPVITLKDGKKISIPRYYKEKLFTEQERKHIADIFKTRYEEETSRPLTDQEFENIRIKHIHLNNKLKKSKKHGKDSL